MTTTNKTRSKTTGNSAAKNGKKAGVRQGNRIVIIKNGELVQPPTEKTVAKEDKPSH